MCCHIVGAVQLFPETLIKSALDSADERVLWGIGASPPGLAQRVGLCFTTCLDKPPECSTTAKGVWGPEPGIPRPSIVSLYCRATKSSGVAVVGRIIRKIRCCFALTTMLQGTRWVSCWLCQERSGLPGWEDGTGAGPTPWGGLFHSVLRPELYLT